MKMTFLRKKNYRNRVGFDPEKRSEGNDANLLLHYCLELVLAAKRVFFYFWVAIARSPVAALCTSMTGSRPGVALHRRLMTGMC